MTKVLNLYAGIGGNRKHWEDVDVTAVEINPQIARYYQEQFPQDNVIVADAHTFLEQHIGDGWDFVWSSPPCPTHSKTNYFTFSNDKQSGQYLRDPVYPDMGLYQEIIFLQTFSDPNTNWVVENVQPYYDPLIEPQHLGRHAFWSSRPIATGDFDSLGVKYNEVSSWTSRYGFDVDGVDFGDASKRKVLRNCVDPELGKHVFESVVKNTQSTLTEVHS